MPRVLLTLIDHGPRYMEGPRGRRHDRTSRGAGAPASEHARRAPARVVADEAGARRRGRPGLGLDALFATAAGPVSAGANRRGAPRGAATRRRADGRNHRADG